MLVKIRIYNKFVKDVTLYEQGVYTKRDIKKPLAIDTDFYRRNLEILKTVR